MRRCGLPLSAITAGGDQNAPDGGVDVRVDLCTVDLSAIYGHEADRFDERLYILNLFQLAFSSPHQRPAAFAAIDHWDARTHPTDDTHFDWRAFQQTYRDYIDLAKLAQMIPIVGAPIGAVVNWRLLERLGETAMNGYRQRALSV